MTGKSLISQNAQLQAVREEHKGKIEQVVAMRKKLPSELHPMLDEILKGMGVDSE
jgi:hypothetical protein